MHVGHASEFQFARGQLCFIAMHIQHRGQDQGWRSDPDPSSDPNSYPIHGRSPGPNVSPGRIQTRTQTGLRSGPRFRLRCMALSLQQQRILLRKVSFG